MFKSLLRTIPTMSGNFKINCCLSDNIQVDKYNYESYIRIADISPLQNILLNKSMKLSLLNGSYEYDICKYFKYYSNKFYSDNYSFDKFDYQQLDLYTDNRLESRNKDYEFGCKRLHFSQTGYQMNFYAPIWCDDINDLPDFFDIKLRVGNIEKNIKIYIGKYHIKNYLKIYLEKYINKIDDNVIILNHGSKSAVYYGIDVNKGGLNAFNDFIISKIFTTQLSQNDFDNLITSGFKRNNIIIRQVMPLSFSFNLADFFSESELKYFSNHEVLISGNYNSLNMNYNLEDFDIDYYNFNLSKKIYNYKTLNFDTVSSSKNMMDQKLPGLNEKRNILYKYENKLSPLYNRWVLNLSDKYYINNNNIYNNIFDKSSDLVDLSVVPNNFMEFPIEIINNLPNAYFTNGNNMIIPFCNDLLEIDKDYNYFFDKNGNKKEPLNNYIRFMNNFLTTWFNIYPIEEYNIDTKNKSNLFSDLPSWKNVKNNEIYFNGILFNFNQVLKNISQDIKLDRFNIFVNPILKSNIELNEKIYYIRGVVNKPNGKEPNTKISLQYDADEKYNNYVLGKNDKGSIIDSVYYDNDYLSKINKNTGEYVKLENYYNNNVYFNYNDFISYLEYYIEYDENYKIFSKYSDLIDDFKNYLYVGDVLLPFYSYDNLLDNNGKFVYENIINYVVVNSNDPKEIEKYNRDKSLSDFLVNNLKYSIANDANKYGITNLNIEELDSHCYLYLSTKLISAISIKSCINKYFSKFMTIDYDDVNSITQKTFEIASYSSKYEYISLCEDTSKKLNDYFICSDYNKDIIYYNNLNVNNINIKDYCVLLDLYNTRILKENLSKYGYGYFGKDSNNILFDGEDNPIRKYGKFLDVEHIKNYITNEVNEYINECRSKDDGTITPVIAPFSLYNKIRKTKIVGLESNYKLDFLDEYNEIFRIRVYISGSIDNYNIDIKIIEIDGDGWPIEDTACTIDDFINRLERRNDGLFIYREENSNRYKILNLYFDGNFILLNDELYSIFEKNNNILLGLYLYINEFDNNYNHITEYDYEIDRENVVGECLNVSVKPLFIDYLNTENNSNYLKKLFNSNNIKKHSISIKIKDKDGNDKDINTNYFVYTKYDYPLLVHISIHPEFYNFNNLSIDSIIMTIDGQDLDKYEAQTKIKDIILNPDNYKLNRILFEYDFPDVNGYNNDNIHKICVNISGIKDYTVFDIYQFRLYLIKMLLMNYNFTYQTPLSILLDDNYNTYDIFKNISLNIVNNVYIDNKKIGCYDNLLVYKNEDDGLTYGMYILEVNCNKSSNIFRYVSDNNDEGLMYVEKINGTDISKIFKKSFKYILPCLNTSLFSFFRYNVNSLLNLKQSKINMVKRTELIDNGNTKNSYKYSGVYYNENDSNKNVYNEINVNIRNNYENVYRYFGKIMPSFVAYNNNFIKNRFSLLYKDIKNYINENNIINESLNIYKYNPLTVCNQYLNGQIDYIKIDEIEHKHFNDNKFYLLKSEIIIEKSEYYEYDKLLELESNEMVLNEFKNYLLKSLKTDTINDDKLLFLFNRYKYNLLSEPVRLNPSNTGKLYKLVYKFTLK